MIYGPHKLTGLILTMRNILRMYGICMEEERVTPQLCLYKMARTPINAHLCHD